MALQEGVQLSVMNSIQEVSFVLSLNRHYGKSLKSALENLRFVANFCFSRFSDDLREIEVN